MIVASPYTPQVLIYPITAEIKVSNEEQVQSTTDVTLDEDQVTLESQDSGEAAAADGGSDLGARIIALEEELANAKEQSLRAVAEAQNVRRRAEQDVEKAHKFGLERFVNDILPVVDNLERALEAANVEGADPAVLNEGVELTLKTLTGALQGHKVDVVDPEGTPFDPQFHQAISAVESAETEPNTVLNVVQKGYTLHGRLVRPAMVVVSKAGA